MRCQLLARRVGTGALWTNDVSRHASILDKCHRVAGLVSPITLLLEPRATLLQYTAVLRYFVCCGCNAYICNTKVLANCAGFAIAREFDEMKMADFERLLRVNTLGTAYVTRALLPGMKAAGGGRILFTSSMAGQVGVFRELNGD